MSISEDRVRKEITFLNERLPQEIYSAVDLLGFERKRCLMFEVFPDSGNTYVVRLLKHDGIAYELDLDLDNPQLSTIEEMDKSYFAKRSGQITWKVLEVMSKEMVDAS